MNKISCDSLFFILPPDFIDPFLRQFPSVEEFELEDDFEITRPQWLDVLKWLTKDSPARGKKITLRVTVEDQPILEESNVHYVDFGFKPPVPTTLSIADRQRLVANLRKPWKGYPFWSGPLSDAALAAQEKLKPVINMSTAYKVTYAIGHWLDGNMRGRPPSVIYALRAGEELRGLLRAKQPRWAALNRILDSGTITHGADHPSLISDEEWFDISPL